MLSLARFRTVGYKYSKGNKLVRLIHERAPVNRPLQNSLKPLRVKGA
jgi:hypothetical protein